MQDGRTDEMVYTVGDTLALISHTFTLRPGDLLATGTPSGVGYARTPPWLLQPGDVVEVEVERLGILTTPITAKRSDVKPTSESFRSRGIDRCLDRIECRCAARLGVLADLKAKPSMGPENLGPALQSPAGRLCEGWHWVWGV